MYVGKLIPITRPVADRRAPTRRIALLSLAAVLGGGCQDTTYPTPTPEFATREIVLGTETQITSDPAYQRDPAISGDRIVWTDTRNGNSDIYLYDLASSTETQITSGPTYQYAPAISGDRIVWTDFRNGNGDIYLYDLGSGVERQITPTHAAALQNSAISGDRIVWTDGRNGNIDIYLYDLATGTETQITNDPVTQLAPSISGDRIVWSDWPSSAGDGYLYLYDLASSTETQITSDQAFLDNPAISGDRIVWGEFRSGNRDIYLYDLASGTENQITSDPTDQGHPAISGDRIVWEDYRNGSFGDIYVYDLAGEVAVLLLPVSGQLEAFLEDGSISNPGTAEPMNALLVQASAAIVRGNENAARATLGAFIRLVSGQSGRGINAAAAQTLIYLAQAAIDGLGS